jgi:hypothetical protein
MPEIARALLCERLFATNPFRRLFKSDMRVQYSG